MSIVTILIIVLVVMLVLGFLGRGRFSLVAAQWDAATTYVNR